MNFLYPLSFVNSLSKNETICVNEKLILSYDYELFFGDKSGTVQKTLIEPTKHLLDSFRKTHLRANFFIDYLMLKNLKEVNDAYTSNKDIALIEVRFSRW